MSTCRKIVNWRKTLVPLLFANCCTYLMIVCCNQVFPEEARLSRESVDLINKYDACRVFVCNGAMCCQG